MQQPRPTVVIADDYSEAAINKLGAVADIIRLPSPSAHELSAALATADALLVRTRTRVSAISIAAAPRLRVIGRAGVGVENIDLDAARARGIPVLYTPAAATEAVAELTIGLILALERRIAAGDAAIRAGAFDAARRAALGRELGQCVLGIVGMGRIGRAVGRIAALGFGCRVLYNDIVPVEPLGFPAESVSKPELFGRADVLSLHLPLTETTRHLIDAAAIAMFKPSSTLINTARGAVIDAAALAAALRDGRLAGAAIDVFEPEPPPADHPLLSAPHVLLSPHAGARSPRGLGRMDDVIDDLLGVLEGRPARHDATR